MNDKIALKMVKGINLIETSNYIGNAITFFKRKPAKAYNQRFFLVAWPRLETDKQKPKLIKLTNKAVLP